MAQRTTEKRSIFDVIIIGAGPGGYVAAIRASQLGFTTALVEKRATLGGTCLNIGCIPSKALLDSSELYHTVATRLKSHGITAGAPAIDVPKMMARKNKIVDELTRGVAMLMRKNKVEVLHGAGRLARRGGRATVIVQDDEGRTSELSAKRNILLAAGSVPVELPFAKFDERVIVSSTGALEFNEVPERLVVVGAGYIGLELGSVWRRLGAEVVMVEMLPDFLPFMDREAADALFRALKKQGLLFHMNTRVTGIETSERGAVVSIADADGGSAAIECDKTLICVGRRPCTEGLGLDAASAALDDKGRVAIDDDFCTTAEGVSAIGDLVRGPMLAHKAEEEGVAWAELLAGKAGRVNYDAIPSIVYTWPEAAAVGLTEQQARERYDADVRTGKFPFAANGRAKAMDENDGFVKIISGPRGRLLGAHIVGPRASDLIAEAVIVIEFGGTAEDIARTCHAHPTLSEAVKEAALAADGRGIHS
ncbi:MAG: dihydrolipoyl dehydrogenase [Candidatus Sumerlaeota bacterium]|nr:dihydrolipoyl dehydrogenase [Candidatus Sumerlaeota bacterium]